MGVQKDLLSLDELFKVRRGKRSQEDEKS